MNLALASDSSAESRHEENENLSGDSQDALLKQYCGGQEQLMETNADALLEVVILLGAAVVAVPLFKKIGLGAVLGYLISGLVIASSGLLHAFEIITIRHFAEFGVIFLLFMIGLELRPSKLWAMRAAVFGLGSLQILITAAAIGFYAIYEGLQTNTAIVIGFGMALSSTAIGLQLLNERGELASRHGQTAFSILLMQDIAIVPLIALLPYLAGGRGSVGGFDPFNVVEDVAAIAGTMLAVRFVLRPALHLVAKYGSREVFAATAVLAVLASAWLMEAVELSMALGAFLTGLMLSDSEYVRQIEADVEVFRAPLLGLFFMSVGMSVDVKMLLVDSMWLHLLQHSFFIILIKGVLLYYLCRAFGCGKKIALRVALLLPQCGEFGFVLFGMANALGIQSPTGFQLAMVVIAVSMAVTPLLVMVGDRILEVKSNASQSGSGTLDEADQELESHVLLIGFGRVGETIAMVFRGSDVPYLALTKDADQIRIGRSRGHPVYYGDPTLAPVLSGAKTHDARLVVVALDDPKESYGAVTAIRSYYPSVPIVARAYNFLHAAKLEDAGATLAIPDAAEASLQLGRASLFQLGLPDDVVEETMDSYRRDHYKLVRAGLEEKNAQD